MDALRGYENEVVLNVERDGAMKEISVNLYPYQPVIGSTGVYFSGILLAKNKFLDRDKFYNKGNAAAGTRVRKNMHELKSLAQALRLAVQAANNADQ